MSRTAEIPPWVKVVVPVGCVLGLSVVGFAVWFIDLVQTTLTTSEPYTHAVQVAKENPTVSSVLGPPIEEGNPGGELSLGDGPAGSASLTIPLHGVHEKGFVSVDATKDDGTWSYQSIGFWSESGVEIDLLSE